MSLEQIVECISKDPSERHDQELNELVPWFLNKCPLQIKPDVAKDILRNCEFKESRRDDVIIRQGDVGDCFFICLTGKVSVFINTDAVPDDPSEAQVLVDDEGDGNDEDRRELDRTKYGKFIVSFGDGKSFGELALINKDCVRNASIIADERTLLIVVNRALYNRSLKAVQEAELRERINFVNACSVFDNWMARYKRQAAMSLRKEKFGFDAYIARQGDPLNGIYFIVAGQAKVVVDIIQHYSQFPQLKLHDSPEELHQKEVIGKIMEQHHEEKPAPLSSARKQQLWEKPLRRQGYAAAEQRQSQRHVEISIIGPGEMIGDIEHGMELNTYAQSFVCTQPTEVYVLDSKNFERLVMNKRNQAQTLEILARKAETKLMSRVTRALDRQVPLIRSLCHKIVEQHKAEERRRQRAEKDRDFEVKDADTSHFIPSRGPLIDPFGPGTVFYRNKMKRERRMAAQKLKQSKAGRGNAAKARAGMFAVVQDTAQQPEQQPEQQLTDEEEDDEYDPYNRRPVDDFEDFDTSSEHLADLEKRISAWFENVDKTKKGTKVVQMTRFKKESDQKIHPGKKVFLRPKHEPRRLTGSQEADEWGYKSEEEIFITAQADIRSRLSSRNAQQQRHQPVHSPNQPSAGYEAESQESPNSGRKKPNLHSRGVQRAEGAASQAREAAGNVSQLSQSHVSGRPALPPIDSDALPADARNDPVGFAVHEHLTAAEKRENTTAILRDILSHQMLPDDIKETLKELEKMSNVMPDLDAAAGCTRADPKRRVGHAFRARSILLPSAAMRDSQVCHRCRKHHLAYTL